MPIMAKSFKCWKYNIHSAINYTITPGSTYALGSKLTVRSCRTDLSCSQTYT